MKPLIERHSPILFAALLVLCACFAHSQVSPFQGLGSAQFFDNNGNELTSGVLYSYAAGTTTQQATYTDSTGVFANPNPLPFSSGGRVTIWLTSTLKYKFVLCLQNDGSFCAPADVLFSVDQVPGCAGCSAAGGTTFTGTFISGTTNPATTGILELASTDPICWRNQAGTTNLCITKDSSDILSWSGSTIKLPETNCTVTGSSYDYLCPNVATHHLSASLNTGAYGSIPILPASGGENHLTSLLANGIDLQDSGGTAPASTVVTFSATPTFAATSQDQLFTMLLTGNVTGSTLTMTSLPTPSLITFELTQDATGGRTFVWPSNVLGAPSITGQATVPNAITVAQFVWDGTNARNISPAQIPSFYPTQRVTSSSSGQPTYPLTLSANTQTIALTETVTFPVATGPFRVDVRYGVWITANSNICSAMVVDPRTRAHGASLSNIQTVPLD